MKKKRIKRVFLFLFALLITLLYLFPFVLVILNSFKERIAIVKDPLGLPEKWSFQNYTDAFETMKFGSAFINSLIITVVSVILIVLFGAMLGYFLVRWKWKLNKFIFLMLVASMIIPFQAVMIPFVQIYGNLDMLNSKWSLSFFYLGFGISLATFMYHGFIKNIPIELEEAAMIDGASRFQLFLKVVFPMLKPITTTIAILDVLWIWNDFLLPSLVLISEDQRTIPLSTFYFFGKYTSNYGSAMAALVLAITPVLIFYLIAQKQIIRGVMEGSIK